MVQQLSCSLSFAAIFGYADDDDNDEDDDDDGDCMSVNMCIYIQLISKLAAIASYSSMLGSI